jgi:hypothetical protein
MTSEIVDSQGNIVKFPESPPPSPQEEFLSALSHATPWQLYDNLPEEAQFVVNLVLALGAVFGLIIIAKRLRPFKTPLPRVIAFAGAASFWLCVLCAVFVVCLSVYVHVAFEDYRPVAFGNIDRWWFVSTTMACVYLVLTGTIVRALARRS